MECCCFLFTNKLTCLNSCFLFITISFVSNLTQKTISHSQHHSLLLYPYLINHYDLYPISLLNPFFFHCHFSSSLYNLSGKYCDLLVYLYTSNIFPLQFPVKMGSGVIFLKYTSDKLFNSFNDFFMAHYCYIINHQKLMG